MRDPPTVPNTDGHHRPLLFVVEGSNDISAMTILSQILAATNSSVPDLGQLAKQGALVFIPIGGNPMRWVDRLEPLHCSEVHVYDRELAPESAFRYLAAGRVNQRRGCRAFLTASRSLENYLHPRAITQAGGAAISIGPDDCVATKLARRSLPSPTGCEWSKFSHRERQKDIQKAKRWLNTVAVKHMTADLLSESDPAGDIIHWLLTIRSMLSGRWQAVSASNCGSGGTKTDY